MGLGFTLFGKPLLTLGLTCAGLAGVYLLPEFWPDHAIAADAIRRDDVTALDRLLARGLDPDTRAQWRSFMRTLMGRVAREGAGDDQPELGAASAPLVVVAVDRCAGAAARRLVEAGASLAARVPDGATLLERAAACGDTALVEALLSRGADPNAPSPDGGTVRWQPASQGWRQRPVTDPIGAALDRAGAVRPGGLSPQR